MTDNPARDLVRHAAEEQPVDFKRTVEDALADRVREAVASRRAEVVSVLFGARVEEPTEDEDEDGEAS